MILFFFYNFIINKFNVYYIAVLKNRKNLKKKKTWAKKFFLKNNLINSKINTFNKPINFNNLKLYLINFI